MSIPQRTDSALRSHLDSHQVNRERLCIALLSLDARFTNVRPRRPKGGPDGGRDIEATFERTQVAYGAVGFKNSAKDSKDERKAIRRKFKDDLAAARAAKPDLEVFVFFTNVDLTPAGERSLKTIAAKQGVSTVEIMDRERMRILLDSPRGLAFRFQYLGLSLSEAEQTTFFNEFGSELQALITRRFERVDQALARLEFLLDCTRKLLWLQAIVHLDKEYTISALGHFRVVLEFRKRRSIKPTFWIASRDAYIPWFGGAIREFRYRTTIGNMDQETILFEGESPSYQIERISAIFVGGELADNFPLHTLSDLDQHEIVIHTDARTAARITSIELLANTYQVSKVDGAALAEIMKSSVHRWPLRLTEEEQATAWVTLHKRPTKPMTLYTVWYLDFHNQTPRRSAPEPSNQ